MSLELTGTTEFYAQWKVEQGAGANFASDSFKMILCKESYVPDLEGDVDLTDITAHEVDDTGYARQALANTQWGIMGLAAVFSFDPVVFQAPDGDIPCKYWVIYDETLGKLVCCGLLNNNGQAVTIEDGKDMTISFIGGLLSISEAA